MEKWLESEYFFLSCRKGIIICHVISIYSCQRTTMTFMKIILRMRMSSMRKMLRRWMLINSVRN